MLGGKNKDLLEIERLIEFKKFQEALHKLDDFEKKGDLSKEENLRLDILKTSLTKEFGQWEEGLELIEQIVEESKVITNKLVFLDALIVKAEYLMDIEKYDNVIAITDTGIGITEKEDATNKEYLIRKAYFLAYKGLSKTYKGEHNTAQEMIGQAFVLSKEVNNDNLVINLYRINQINEATRGELKKGLNQLFKALECSIRIKNDLVSAIIYAEIAENYHFMGKFKQGLEYIEKAMKIYKKHDFPTLEIDLLKAFNYYSSGQIKESFEIYKRILPQLEEIHRNFPRELGFYFWCKAMVEYYEGNLDNAIELTEEAYNISLELGNRYLIMAYESLLSLLLLDSNQIERALDLSLASLEDYKDLNFLTYKSLNYETLGRIFHIRGEYKLAIEYLERSLQLRNELGMIFQAIRTLFHLLNAAIDKNDDELSIKCLTEIEELHNKEPRESQEQFCHISKALVLKASNLHKNWKIAIDELADIAEEEVQYYPLKVTALINLCELLMNEFSSSRNLEVLEKLEENTKKLEKIANSQKQTSYILRIEAKNIQLLTIWLKAQYFKDEVNLKKTQKLLEEARIVADKEGLIRLVHKLTQQQEKLYEQLTQ